MNNMIWDAVLWLRKKLNRDKEDIITAVNNIQNLFETSADATASPSDILAGKTAYNGTVLLTGSMKDRRGMTVTSGTVTQDDEYTYLTVPEEACFNASSKLRTKNSNISRRYEIPVKITAVMSPASSSTPAQQRSTDITIVINNGNATVVGTPSIGVGVGSYGSATASVAVGKIVT